MSAPELTTLLAILLIRVLKERRKLSPRRASERSRVGGWRQWPLRVGVLLGLVLAVPARAQPPAPVEVEERAGRWLKLLSGTVMLALGLALLFWPRSRLHF